MWKTFETFVGMENFTFREMHVGENQWENRSVSLSSVVYYCEDLLKSGNGALVQNKIFISL